MLYSKNGSIPKPETDGTEGWIEVPDAPECPEGKEVVWLNWEWVIRDPKPQNRDGFVWKWNHDAMQWIEYQIPSVLIQEGQVLETGQLAAMSSAQMEAIDSQQLSAL